MNKLRGSFLLTSAMVALMLLTACNSLFDFAKFENGNGSVKSESRTVAGFSKISLGLSGKMTVTKGDSESLTIEADDNLLALITSAVKGGTLEIDSDSNLNPSKPIKYTVTVLDLQAVTVGGSGDITVSGLPQLAAVTIGGSGSVEVADLDSAAMTVDIGGSGTVTLAGKSGDLHVSISGSGQFAGAGLSVPSANVNVSGSGSAAVNATETLDVNISGSGTVTYSGAPQVTKSISGSGSVLKR